MSECCNPVTSITSKQQFCPECHFICKPVSMTTLYQGSFVVGGANYGQGSSREHAALGPRYLGVKAVIAKSFARIHLQNLGNFGILPLIFTNSDDWKNISQSDLLSIPDARNALRKSNRIQVINLTKGKIYETEHLMTPYQVEMVLAGSLINLVKQKGLSSAKNQS